VNERFTVQWTQTAVDDLLSIIDYVAGRDGAEAAERLYGQVKRDVERLDAMPHRCRVVPELQAEGIDGYRELLIGPYRLMFVIRGSDVVILTAVDGRRDLGELLVERALRDRE
jgi:plasmid stabilization system protein ParE